MKKKYMIDGDNLKVDGEGAKEIHLWFLASEKQGKQHWVIASDEITVGTAGYMAGLWASFDNLREQIKEVSILLYKSHPKDAETILKLAGIIEEDEPGI